MIQVRALATPQEIETFLRHAIEVYQPDADVEAVLPGQVAAMGALPDLARGGYRAAFVDGELAGGYRLLDRTMRFGPARLRTGCVGAVYTRTQFRNRGIARAMMLDAIDFTTAEGYALLLLGGILNFYDKFGYADIHAVTRFVMKADDLTFDRGDWSTRVATEDDAKLMLDFYGRHFGRYRGCFDRSLDEQRHRLRFGPPRRQFVLSLDPEGIPRGYVDLESGNRGIAREVVADSWSAAANLLHCHASFAADADDPSDEIAWVLPQGSPLAIELIGHLSLKAVTTHHHIGGWMARVANVETLLESLLPLWREKLRMRNIRWTGVIEVALDAHCWSLNFDGGDIQVFPLAMPSKGALSLTQEQFIQLCFAYPAAYVAADGALAHLPSPAQETVLSIFVEEPFWIAGTDGF